MHKIGVRYEDKYAMERRVPLVPDHVKKLIDAGLKIEIVKSPKRIFKDEEYKKAGAEIVDELTDSDIVLGVKEMPIDFFRKNKTYIFFSHTIKGQAYNMPALKKMMEQEVNLIDYERIVDEKDRRLIFFGRFAGLAGMTNSLWSVGQRLAEFGIETPFLKIQQTHHYGSLDEIIEVVSSVGQFIAKNGLPVQLPPFVVGITGYGNVSKGAQEILDLLPTIQISPAELLNLHTEKNLPNNVVYKVVFEEKDLSIPIEDGKAFDLQEYYKHPERFKDQFAKYIPHLSILMNCMYWNDKYPRIVTKDYLEKLFSEGRPKLLVIGDVTCDPDGSVECTHKGTEIEDPVFVYNPLTRKPTMGFKGEGILVMAVDILPSELPREASQTFSDALIGFIPEIAKADFMVPFADLKLPDPIKKALILHNGKLTPEYQYLKNSL